jgi:hypothetical protein
MGGLPEAHGLSIKMVSVSYGKNGLTRVSEAGVITAFGSFFDVALLIRQIGLKVGMRFRPADAAQAAIAFTAGQAGTTPTSFTPVSADAGITTKLQDVFGTADGKWIGFKVPANQIPDVVGYPTSEDRLFFRVTLPNFNLSHKRGLTVQPVVAVTDNFSDFTGHYALGLSVFTLGTAEDAIEFDTQVLGSE